MMRLSCLHAMVVGLSLLVCEVEDEPRPEINATKKKDEVRVPDLNVIPPPPPVVPQGEVPQVPTDQMYVIDSDVELLVIDVPTGVVKISPKTGPMSIGGKFAGGNGTFEFRDFKGKYLYVVTATSAGRVELIWAKELNAAKVRRQPIDFVGGVLPNPDEDPALTKFQKVLQAAYEADTDADKGKSVVKLAAIYTSLGEVKNMDTWVGLYQSLVKKTTEAELDGKVLNVKKAIADELRAIFPSGQLDPNLKMTADDKQKAKRTFKRVETALMKVK